jgi:hypothetical protein
VLMIEIRIKFPACVCQGSIVMRLFITSIKWRQNKTSFLKWSLSLPKFPHLPRLRVYAYMCVLNLVTFIVNLWRSMYTASSKKNGDCIQRVAFSSVQSKIS